MDNFIPDATTSSNRNVFVIAIVLIIIVATVLIWYFKPRAKEALSLGPYILLDRTKSQTGEPNWKSILTAEQATLTSGNNTTCSFFVYMDDINRERIPIVTADGGYMFKYLVLIGNSIGIKLDPIHQKAIVTIVPMPAADRYYEQKNIVIEKFLIAKWNQITVTVEGRTVDIYINGKLESSTLLDNVPYSSFNGLMLNTSPDFSGQAGLFQMWPERRTISQIHKNYKRNTDTRGKPLIPDKSPSWRDILDRLKENMCSNTGICGLGVQAKVGPMQYVNYEFA
jgi:hypothetical protein